ncbi:hypothetical protein IMZ48_01850 [Candidatus Bathyarchaeota archaeon]|nr:hypothetical protein [Candidatus Bathyarchaeota archaeon]
MEVIRKHLEITVTELEAAQYLTSLGGHAQAPTPEDPSASESSVPLAMLRHARSINLSLYRDPAFYHALTFTAPAPGDWTPAEYMNIGAVINAGAGGLFKVPHVRALLTQADAWRKFCAGLAALPRVNRVTLWLDNNDQTWSGTDEMELLSPLIDAAGRLSKAVISVYLPEVCADKLDPKRHFLAGEALPLVVQRGNRRPVRSGEDMPVGMGVTVNRISLRLSDAVSEMSVMKL